MDMAPWTDRINSYLQQILPDASTEPDRLHSAMRYSALSGGKRIRPLLVYAAANAVNQELDPLDSVACAIELIHAYSLIHDDLPAMDDDDLRRGRQTCHLAFDEATAILAGDALQALAFECLARENRISGLTRVQLLKELAVACGSTGMAGGQMLDLLATGQLPVIAELETIHNLKTGALISFCIVAPAWVANCDESELTALNRTGHCIGLGFQIRDDILDVTGDTEQLGKSAHADMKLNKPTFPSLLGMDESVRRARLLRDEALDRIETLKGDTAPLAWLADYMISRDR